MDYNAAKHISSKFCAFCHGPTDGFKCPRCGYALERYDPLHWQNCKAGGKMRAQCKGCNEAEDNCICR